MQLGILLGGLIPAILFGISGIFQKISANQQVSLGPHLITIGIGVAAVGLALVILTGEQDFTLKKLIPSVVIGVSWGSGMVLIAIAIIKYGAALSVITPLYNMNTLVTVMLAMIIFAEWKDANLVKLTIGTLLIVGGGILVAGSSESKSAASTPTNTELEQD